MFGLSVADGAGSVALRLSSVVDAGQCSDHRSSHGVVIGAWEPDLEIA